MSTLKNGEFGIDLDKEKILWTDRKRHTVALQKNKKQIENRTEK